MSYKKKIVLHCPNGCPANLEQLVAEFRAAGVIYVGVVGQDCARIEDIIDELCVGLGDNPYDLLTTSHPEESLDEVVEFAGSLDLECSDPVQVVDC
jgi:hypothetical protein